LQFSAHSGKSARCYLKKQTKNSKKRIGECSSGRVIAYEPQGPKFNPSIARKSKTLNFETTRRKPTGKTSSHWSK
jgi:hypothetical protein